jgi:hypothetical protein
MANILDPMCIKQIFSLQIRAQHFEIGAVLGISGNIVNQCLSWLTASAYGVGQILPFTNDKFKGLFPYRMIIKKSG